MSPRTIERARQLGEWSRVRARSRDAQAKGSTPVELRDGIYIINADPTNSPFFHPIDLEGKTIVLDRRADGTFMSSTAPLAWDYDTGDVVPFDANGTIAIELPFNLPFFDRTLRRLYVSPQHALYLAPPRATGIDQRSELEAVTSTEGVIAPFLTTAKLQPETPTVEIKLRADAATITWTIPEVSSVQAVLTRNGYIRFGYRKLGLKGGTVVVTSGSEAWRSERTRLASRLDDPDDVPNRISEPLKAMLDIQSVTAERISDLDVIEVRINTRAALNRTAIPNDDQVIYTVTVGSGGTIALRVGASGPLRYSLPAWGGRDDSPAARLEGSTVVLDIPQSEIEPFASTDEVPFGVSVQLSSIRGGDTVAPIIVPLDAPKRRIGTDFTSLGSATAMTGPIAEAFTLPEISVERVWDELRAATGMRGEELDGVAIYQNFLTDIVLYAGAYSTGGNAGATGVTDNPSVGPSRPLSPGLMHMNAINYGWNRSPQTASFIMLHELGHHWLFSPFLMEDGERRQTINPDGIHPAQFVDFRAAFPVYTDHDVSVMGGGAFKDNLDGSFTSTEFASYGYSWLDLYLMGLAGPDEVTSFFYIADSTPRLGNSYFPPGLTVRGRRVDVYMHQVLDAMPTRLPAYPNTPRKFHTIFVLLADPRRPVTDAEVAAMNGYRLVLERDFRIATGRRASVTTAFEPTPIHRRALR